MEQSLVTKLVWEVSLKKDTLWIRWAHGKYLINKDWWRCRTMQDVCWYWTKLYSVKEKSKWGSLEGRKWFKKDDPQGRYTVGLGYKWYLDLYEGRPISAKLIWSKTSISRQSFTAWLLLKQKLCVSTRLKKYLLEMDMTCNMCNEGEETLYHLFYTCT